MTQTMVPINNPYQLRPAPYRGERVDTMQPAGCELEKFHGEKEPEGSPAFGLG